MANTRQSTKRAVQADKRQERNRSIRTATRSAVSGAVLAISKKDAAAPAAYAAAIKALAKAGSKGAIPTQRAARKISRLTLLAKKAFPAALKAPAAPAAK